jgi:pimeloyl-ACP methyl ester carboxylesterase
VTPVVFLHGIGGGARSFAPQIASFASAGYQPVALDLPGYGAREPIEVMSFEALAEDVEFAISEAGLERAVLVGHSMGGMVVQTMLRRRPDDYGAIVLSCTSPAFGNPAGDFQKKFVADRLEPLDAGYTMADVAPAAMRGIWHQGAGAVPCGRVRPQRAASGVGKDGGENPRCALRLPVRPRPYAEPRGTAGFRCGDFQVPERCTRCGALIRLRHERHQHAQTRCADLCARCLPAWR